MNGQCLVIRAAECGDK